MLCSGGLSLGYIHLLLKGSPDLTTPQMVALSILVSIFFTSVVKTKAGRRHYSFHIHTTESLSRWLNILTQSN